MGGDRIASIPRADDLPLFNLQKRIALRNCGHIDPESISHYIAAGQGYGGLSRALQMSRLDVIEEVRKSRLRGRGGAGHHTAEKWKTVYDASGYNDPRCGCPAGAGPDGEKYVVCYGVDGDPRARTAQLLLESDPHSVLEGLLIAAYAAGASRSFVCVDVGRPHAIARLRKALEQAREYGLLGDAILDSSFSAEIEIREVTPSLILGEESALLRLLEGKQAMPYLRPAYPGALSTGGRPTLINNIETLSNVSAIFQNDSDWFARVGSEQSRGTKVVTLGGSLAHKYTVEIPFGTTLKTLVYDLGGGSAEGKHIKAIQFGGPTGVYLTPDALDTRLDYEAIISGACVAPSSAEGTEASPSKARTACEAEPAEGAGSFIGSGTIEVVDSDACAVETTEAAVSFLQSQSCGKCVFCREGTFQMSDVLNDIARGEGKPQDLDLLTELGEEMATGSICNFGRTAPNPVLSSIKLFRSEYEAHIKERRCPAGDKSEIAISKS
jgi:NADH:ubiquinone oxidoreductase subunit F (NADH-binding)